MNAIHFNFASKNMVLFKLIFHSTLQFKHLIKRRLKNRPLVTIVIPYFNEGQVAIDCIQSVMNQDYTNFECIIVNDCSTNVEQLKIIATFIAKDKRFKIVNNAINQGLASTRNKGIELATGKYIAFLDSDDILLKSSLFRRVYQNEIFERDPSFAGSYSEILSLEEKVSASMVFLFNNLYHKTPLKNFLTLNLDCPFVVHAPLVRLDVMRQFLFNEKMLLGFEDWECWLRMLRAGYQFKGTHTFGGIYRQRAYSMVRTNAGKMPLIAQSIISSQNHAIDITHGPYPFTKPINFYHEQRTFYSRTILYLTICYLKKDETSCLELLKLVDDKAFLKNFMDTESLIKKAVSRYFCLHPSKIDNFNGLVSQINNSITEKH